MSILKVLIALAIWFSGAAHALDFVEPTLEQKSHCESLPEGQRLFCASAFAVKGLVFPEEAKSWGLFASASNMAIYKPDGDGPFPAVLILHNCGRLQEPHLSYWVKSALERGYVALMVDSWSQRGLSEGVCGSSPVNFRQQIPVRVRDAYEAMLHLSKFKFVDAAHIGAIGFSHGGRIAYHLASASVANMFSPNGQRFADQIAVYGECFSRLAKLSNVRIDTDRPLLALLGEKDEDGDPAECLPRLQAAKEKGAPVEWVVFPGVGHAWDNPAFNAPTRRAYPGAPSGFVLYGYDVAVTEQTRARVFEHLDRHLKLKSPG